MEKSIPRGRGGRGSVLKNQFEGGSELSDQLLDPDVPTLASQDKLKVSPKGLPFVILGHILKFLWFRPNILHHVT